MGFYGVLWVLYDFLSLNGTHYCKNILIKYIDIGISTCEVKEGIKQAMEVHETDIGANCRARSWRNATIEV